KVIAVHAQALWRKGYVAEAAAHRDFPGVTLIVRVDAAFSRHLQQTLQSIARQSYPNLQVVCAITGDDVDLTCSTSKLAVKTCCGNTRWAALINAMRLVQTE